MKGCKVGGGIHMKIILVVGARPNFMKIAPIIREIKKRSNIKYTLVKN